MNKKLDPELLAYFYDIKSKVSSEHKEYLSSHPEIRQLLTDFMLKVLLTKPTNTYEFARSYFSYFEKKTISQQLKHLLLVGPRGDQKSSLVRLIIDAYPQYFESNITFTTRQPTTERPLLQNERFLTAEQWEENEALGNLFDIRQKGDYKTAKSKIQLDDVIQRGKVCILKMDISRVKTLLQNESIFNVIVIVPGSLEALKESLLNRGKVGISKIDEKMMAIKHELEESARQATFSKRVLNVSPEKSFEQLVLILKSCYKPFNF